MWDLGDYPRVADLVIPHLGEVLVRALDVTAGERVLDVASGAGNAALPAARRGAEVTANDLSEKLLAELARRADEAGLDVERVPGDVEALPFADGAFDVTMSSVGVMFAPHHREAADELLRVTRPGGRIGLINWTPQGFIGEVFAVIKRYVPPPPPGAQPPPLWGDPEHVAELLADGLRDLTSSRATVRVDCFRDPTGFRELFKSSYGPTVAAYLGLASDPGRAADLDAELDRLVRAHWKADSSMDWEYLLVTGTRAADQ